MRLWASVAVAAVLVLGSDRAAGAGAVFLMGTDAMSFHGDGTFIAPVLTQLQGGSPLPVLAVNDFGAAAGFYGELGGQVAYVSPAGFDALADLSPYSAILFASPFFCCSDAGLAGYAGDAGSVALLTAFVAGGGGFAVEDYQGAPVWDAVLDIAPPGAGGVLVPEACVDPGVSTPSGLAFGFDPSYVEFCFVHQVYSSAFWDAQGYFALQTTAPDGAFLPGEWVTMAKGFRDPGEPPVPEPAELALFGLAAAFTARRLRRR
jgi:hypothetical protein